MVDVLSVRENLSAPPPVLASVLPERRTSPTSVKLVLPVWGYEYVRQFLECGLATLLAPGNIPALTAELPCEFIILTSSDDEEFLREHSTFKRLSAVCHTEVRLIDHLITDGNYSTTITLAYTEVVRAAGVEMVDTCFFFLVSDYIMADGSLLSALKRMQAGASAVMVGNFQVSRDEAMPWLQDKLSVAKGALALPPREMMQWALNHLHPTTLANMVNIPFSHNSHTNRVFWRVDGATILGRFYLMHMLCVRPETTDFMIGASCDYSFVPEMCPSGNVDVLTDSDDYLVIEMQPREHEAAFLRPGALKPRALSRSLTEWATATHRENALHSIIFHAADVPPEISASIAEADAYIMQVARGMKRKPLPHRGHPYWRGAMAAFQDATGGKLTRDEWRMALGLPVSSNWLLDWFMWRAQYALLGKPPNVLPWHPLWSDYRRILEELTPFLRDRKQRLLMVSNTPTVFTVSLSDSGERVHRLRGTPFLQSAPERFTPLLRHFDLCLLELSEGEMELGGELIDRIAPLMKADGRIIVSVLNRRSVATAPQFAAGVSHHGSRFIRSGAVPTEIHFAPANRLRWMANRGMLGLRTAVSKTPWLGIPSMLLGGALLMVLSLIGNVDALRPTKRTAPRGIASSLLMRLRVDARNARNVHPFSKFQIRRRQLLKRRLDAVSRKPKDADASWDLADTTRQPQYSRSVELKNTMGLTPLGMVANQIWHDDPRSLAFVLARYKFIAKMLNGRHDVAEVGCGDAFGARIVLQEVENVSVYDPDRIFIEDIRARYDERWPLQSHIHDILEGPLPRRHDGLFSLDEIEYLTAKDEHAYIANLRGSLTDDGVLIIGTRSLESQSYASSSAKVERRNCKSGQELKVLLQQYFSRVFLFSMNDEVVHTGFHPMAQYLFVMCTGPK